MDFEDAAQWVVIAIIGLVFVVIVVLVISMIFVSHVGAVNDGQHTGYVTSVEEEGILWKTWRVYLKTDPQSSQEDKYCVTDTNLVTVLKEKAKDRKLVTVDYSAPLIVWNWECGQEPSIIRSIE